MVRRVVLTGIVCLVLITGLVGPAVTASGVAEDGPEASPTVEATGGDAVAGDELDRLLEDAMDDHDVAGASVAVVEEDELVHVEGYGEADAAAGTAVEPNETSFMVGSVAKLTVWTAVMQGVEDGALELDEPIGTYLENYSVEGEDEITLEQLGTHTPGYEDRLQGLFVDDPAEADDWEPKLERELPAQVRPPGETVAYSNHGTGLAALVVQEAVGEPFEAYVEREVFEPLAMDEATFEQPVPDELAPVSQGHVPTDDGFETDDPTILGVPPAGSMSATATDMGNFAAAVLGDGAFEDDRVLEAESVEAMLDQRATNHPAVDGVGYGYMLGERGGERLAWHTGGTEYFYTLFALFPDRDVALYVSFNTAGSGAALADVLDEFIDQRFGGEESTLEPDPATADRADAYEGEYRTTAFQTTPEKLVGLGESMSVSVTDEGYLELGSPLGGDATRWVEVEPGVFEPAPDEDAGLISTVAIEDDTLYVDAPTPPYERVSWYETAAVQIGVAVLALAAVLSTLVVWPISAYRSRGWGRMRAHLTRPRLAVVGGAAAVLAAVLGLFANVLVDPNQLVYGYSPWLRLALAFLLVVPLAALAVLALVGLEWRRVLGARDLGAGSTTPLGLAYLTVLALALAVLGWQLWYWNLLTAVGF
ncbi:serine hydrolase domain-containing protein [Natronococcus occultus]|uniref:Penicillin-binding protein, beta-lactamase class C n=1 Tax=Natronococcus occultus SP4 TaxID=694430 RepID=L0K3B5_9EURY|nr:serine hydrolase domain-containing protein [Natronococcus occultus]AGB39055.1 penicillin-binding protein, beta-lactamase class C [Natronococcus occultus SP4]